MSGNGYMFTVYLFDMRLPAELGIDTNDLYIGEKFISPINWVKNVRSLSEIAEDEYKYVVLIVPYDTKIDIRNVNLCPDLI